MDDAKDDAGYISPITLHKQYLAKKEASFAKFNRRFIRRTVKVTKVIGTHAPRKKTVITRLAVTEYDDHGCDVTEGDDLSEDIID